MPNTTKKTGKTISGLTTNPNHLELLRQFPPQPIQTSGDLETTQTVIDNLLDRASLTPEEQAYLNVLGALVWEYEEQNVAIPNLYGVELLKALISEFQLKQKDLVSIFKTESIISDILHGKRKLTVEHMKKLGEFFHISPAVFFE